MQLNHRIIKMKKLITTLSFISIVFTMHTQTSPTLIKDIYPGPEDSDIQEVTRVGDRIFFWANDGVHGMELWLSDATEAGTYMVKDIAAGTAFSLWNPEGSYAAKSLTDVNGTAFFFANDGIHGYELWKSDGTEAGTMLVKNIGDGQQGIRPSDNVFAECIAIDGILYFVAYLDGVGHEVWRSDGTEDGTYMIGEAITGDNYTTYPCNLCNAGGSLWFGAKSFNPISGIWRYDGSNLIQISDAFLNKWNQQSQHNFVWHDGYAYFGAGTNINDTHIWRSNGGAMSAEWFIQTNTNGQSRPHTFLTIEDGFLFTAEGEDEAQVFVSDGTVNGTIPLKYADGSIAYIPSGTASGNTDFLLVNGGYYWNGTNGFSFTDGTNEGTYPISDDAFSYHGSDWMTNNSAAIGNHVVFAGDNHNLKSNGTPEGTSIVCDGWNDARTYVALGNKIIMVIVPHEDDEISQELYYIIPEFTVGIEEELNSNHYTVYPNPTYGEFAIRGGVGMMRLKVINQLGSMVWTGSIQSNESINLSQHLANGLYTVKIETREKQEIHRVVISK